MDECPVIPSFTVFFLQINLNYRLSDCGRRAAFMVCGLVELLLLLLLLLSFKKS